MLVFLQSFRRLILHWRCRRVVDDVHEQELRLVSCGMRLYRETHQVQSPGHLPDVALNTGLVDIRLTADMPPNGLLCAGQNGIMWNGQRKA
jgi:hypothetical protein